MSLNCPHAWEEYKKLDLVCYDLCEEFLLLHNGSGEFKNIGLEKVNQWRELYKKVKVFEGEMKDLKELFIVNIDLAKEIMGDQFYGPEEIKNAFGFEVAPEKIPKIPYNQAKLEKAKKLGERLVLRISEDGKGKTMTMKRLNKIAKTRMSKGEGKLLKGNNWITGDAWYKDEDFFNNQSLKMEWKLVGGNLVKGSTNKNYSEQTKVLRDYLLSVNSLTMEELKECSDENLEKIGSDAKKLAKLKINQNHRRSPGEVLYDWFLHFKKFKDRDYLEKTFDWTNIYYPKISLLYLGVFHPVGAHFDGCNPSSSSDHIGVVSVR